MLDFIKKLFGDGSAKEVKRLSKIVDQIDSFEQAHKNLTDAQIREKTEEFRARLKKKPPAKRPTKTKKHKPIRIPLHIFLLMIYPMVMEGSPWM